MLQENRASTDNVILPGRGKAFAFGEVGGHFPITGSSTDQRLAVGELRQIPPHTLGAPLHRHQNEEEYTCVVSGRLGTMAGDEVVVADPGTWLIKPRAQWHTFWNAGEAPCHVIEIVFASGVRGLLRRGSRGGGRLESARGDQREVRHRHGL